MGRMTRLRLAEVGLALVLTMAALLFVALAVWAKEPAAVAISEAWVRPSIGDVAVTAAYMSVTNGGRVDDVLLSAKSARAKRVEIHETTMTDDGVMQMRPLPDGLTIPAGGSTSLKPGGAHLMVIGLDGKLAEGDELPLTLEFEKAGPIEVTVPVGLGPSVDGSNAGETNGHHGHH